MTDIHEKEEIIETIEGNIIHLEESIILGEMIHQRGILRGEKIIRNTIVAKQLVTRAAAVVASIQM